MTLIQEFQAYCSLFGKVLAAKSAHKLSDSIHVLGERHPCLSTSLRKDFAANTTSLKVKKIAGIADLDSPQL